MLVRKQINSTERNWSTAASFCEQKYVLVDTEWILTSVLNASNFWTHEFLLQDFEALYQYFLSVCVPHIAKSKGIHIEERSVVEDISSHLSSLVAQSVRRTCCLIIDFVLRYQPQSGGNFAW